MTRGSFLGSLLAMVLAPLGLRLPKDGSLPANGLLGIIEGTDFTEVGNNTGYYVTPPMPWPVHADDYVFLASETYDHPELTESWAELAVAWVPTI